MLWLLLVYPATVMLQQHYLVDVYAGILVGFSSYWGCMLLVERPQLTPGHDEPRTARHNGGAG
jgi:membrane-associated phospholipid phosphatase